MRLSLWMIAAFVIGGCAATYTDIRKVDDNTYVMTKVKQGFMSVHSYVFVCNPVGTTPDLKCTQIDSP